jgi:hypothetical protein
MQELPGKYLKTQHRADYVRTHYVIFAPEGVLPDDFLEPRFWRNHVGTLRQHDLIEILAEDGSYELTLRVRNFVVIKNGDGSDTLAGVYMRELDRKIFGELAQKPVVIEKEPPTTTVGNLTITWGGPAHKFRILDGTNLVSKGHKTKEAATKAAEDYLAKLKAA